MYTTKRILETAIQQLEKLRDRQLSPDLVIPSGQSLCQVLGCSACCFLFSRYCTIPKEDFNKMIQLSSLDYYGDIANQVLTFLKQDPRPLAFISILVRVPVEKEKAVIGYISQVPNDAELFLFFTCHHRQPIDPKQPEICHCQNYAERPQLCRDYRCHLLGGPQKTENYDQLLTTLQQSAEYTEKVFSWPSAEALHRNPYGFGQEVIKQQKLSFFAEQWRKLRQT